MIKCTIDRNNVNIEVCGNPVELFFEWSLIGAEIAQEAMKKPGVPKELIAVSLDAAVKTIMQEIEGESYE